MVSHNMNDMVRSADKLRLVSVCEVLLTSSFILSISHAYHDQENPENVQR